MEFITKVASGVQFDAQTWFRFGPPILTVIAFRLIVSLLFALLGHSLAIHACRHVAKNGWIYIIQSRLRMTKMKGGR